MRERTSCVAAAGQQRWVMRLAWHPYLRPDVVEHDLTEAARRDRRGHRFHLAAASLFCAGLFGPTSVAELAGIPLMVVFLLRLPFLWRTLGSFVVQPVVIAIAAFVAWQAVSLAWSADRRTGVRELESARWMWAAVMLWPLMGRRQILLWALAGGAALGVVVQAINTVGTLGDVRWLHWFDRPPNRHSGWWDPVVGGSLLVAGLGLFVALALLPGRTAGRGVGRVVAALAVPFVIAAIIATGTRGAWLAGAALVPLAAMVVMWRGERAPRQSRGVVIAAIALAIVAAGLAATQSESIATRWRQARADLASADAGDFRTDTGARVLMAQMAMRAVREHPWTGTGAGGYQKFATTTARNDAPIHRHAHSTPLHIAATLGVPGILIALVVVALALGTTPMNAGHLAFLGLVLAGGTDVVNINAQTSAVLFALLPFCFVSLPPER